MRHRNDDPPEYPEFPCEVCGLDPLQCECPECAVCGVIGDPDCYDYHGLARPQEKPNADT